MKTHSIRLLLVLFICLTIIPLSACRPNSAATKKNYTMPPEVPDSIPQVECTGNLVTPQMYGAVGDGITDDTQALVYAFNSGMDVELISDYFTAGGFRCQASNISIYGNGHALLTAGTDLLHPVLFFDHADNITIKDLEIRSEHDHFPVDVGTHKPLSNQLSSNTYGLFIADSKNITVENYSTYGIMYDTFCKRSENLTFNNWNSINTLMGIYADDTINYKASNFNIVMDPTNTFSGCHNVYLCYGCDGFRFEDGSMTFDNDSSLQNTPVFTMHTTNQIPDGKNISLKNVFIQGQWPLQISNTSDPIRFEQCTFDTCYPEDAVSTSNNGQISVQCDADFTDCIFNLNSFDYGFINGNYEVTVNLTNCFIKDKILDKDDPDSQMETFGKPLYVGNNFTINVDDNTRVDWYNLKK